MSVFRCDDDAVTVSHGHISNSNGFIFRCRVNDDR